MIREERTTQRSQGSSLYLLTGAIIGLVMGLIFSLAIAPLRYKDATPDLLTADAQTQYKVLIAQAYAAEHDMGRVQARWAAFNVQNIQVDLHTLLGQLSAEEGYNANAVALDYLLYDMRGGERPTEAEPTATPEPEDTSQELEVTEVAQVETEATPVENAAEPEATVSEEESALPDETQPPIPTSTVVAAVSKPFQLQERLVLCEEQAPRLLQVQVRDEEGNPLQGIPILLSWPSGSEVFYTGLFPAFDEGYADYDMDPNETYRIQVGFSGAIVDGIRVNSCEREDGTTYPGGWWLAFQP